jgi:hypothetical protein
MRSFFVVVSMMLNTCAPADRGLFPVFVSSLPTYDLAQVVCFGCFLYLLKMFFAKVKFMQNWLNCVFNSNKESFNFLIFAV